MNPHPSAWRTRAIRHDAAALKANLERQLALLERIFTASSDKVLVDAGLYKLRSVPEFECDVSVTGYCLVYREVQQSTILTRCEACGKLQRVPNMI